MPSASASQTAVVVVRTDEGALRASFTADSTLLDVRAWVDESRRVSLQSASAIPAPPPGATGRVLVSNEQTEQIRVGRENFERQTGECRDLCSHDECHDCAQQRERESRLTTSG